MPSWMDLSRSYATWLPVSCWILLSALPSYGQEQTKLCRDGWVVREAFPGDGVCVTPQTHAQVLEDNRQAEARRETRLGWGSRLCRQGFVWRVARPDDLVCVTPDVRARTAADNAAYEAAKSAAAASPPQPSNPFPPPVSSASMYRLGDWSSFRYQDHVRFRYRWRFNPKKPELLEAIFEIYNTSNERWVGTVRAFGCRSNGPEDRREVSVESRKALLDVILPTRNCGDAQRPFLKAGITRRVRFD